MFRVMFISCRLLVQANGRSEKAPPVVLTIGEIRMSGIVIESVTHRGGLRNRVRPDFDSIFTDDLRVGPIPLAVSAGGGKLVELVTIANPQAITCLVKLEHSFMPGELRFAKDRTRPRQLAAVDVRERPERHALTDVEFVLRMNVARFADVDRYDQTGVCNRHGGATLCFA